MEEDKLRKKELNKLRRIFKGIEKNKKDLVEQLMENAAFMAVELKKLQEHIAEHGCTEEYQNGENQRGKKKSSEVEVYNTMIKNYTTIIKQLTELLPKGIGSEADELLEFIGGGKR